MTLWGQIESVNTHKRRTKYCISGPSQFYHSIVIYTFWTCVYLLQSPKYLRSKFCWTDSEWYKLTWFFLKTFFSSWALSVKLERKEKCLSKNETKRKQHSVCSQGLLGRAWERRWTGRLKQTVLSSICSKPLKIHWNRHFAVSTFSHEQQLQDLEILLPIPELHLPMS